MRVGLNLNFVGTFLSGTSVGPASFEMDFTVESLGDIVEYEMTSTVESLGGIVKCEMASTVVLLKDVVSLVLYS